MCEVLLDPTDGDVSVSGRTLDSVATYTCNSGYALSTGGSSFMRVCTEVASWSDSPPTCDSKPSQLSLAIMCAVGILSIGGVGGGAKSFSFPPNDHGIIIFSTSS